MSVLLLTTSHKVCLASHKNAWALISIHSLKLEDQDPGIWVFRLGYEMCLIKNQYTKINHFDHGEKFFLFFLFCAY